MMQFVSTSTNMSALSLSLSLSLYIYITLRFYLVLLCLVLGAGYRRYYSIITTSTTLTAVVEPNIDDSEYLAGKRNTAPEASFEDKQNMDFTKIHKHNEAEVAANV